MTSIKKYKKYRRVGMNLNNKMMKTCLSRETILKSAKLLGIARGDVFVFDTEDEASVLMDFALNDCTVNNRNAVQQYRDTIGWENDIEKEILDARLSSYTSLFKATLISKSEHITYLDDLLNNKKDIPLTDIGFSTTGAVGVLLFTRLIFLKEFNTTSGVPFIFPGYLEQYLLKRYKILEKKVKSDNESVKRFVTFFKLYKQKGIEVQYK